MKISKIICAVLMFCLPFSAFAWCQEGFVVGYQYPAQWQPNDWDKIQYLNKQSAKTITIMNPSSGPGTVAIQDYTDELQDIVDGGFHVSTASKQIRVVAYVSTKYGAEPLQSVKDQIDLYASLYPSPAIKGIFLDEMPFDDPNGDHAIYYDAITQHITDVYGANSLVVLNPGTYPEQTFVTGLSIWGSTNRVKVVTFEGSWATYQTITPPAWAYGQPTEKFVHIVYAAPSTAKLTALSLTKTNHVKYAYITDDVITDGNPFDVLTTYWSALINKINACDY